MNQHSATLICYSAHIWMAFVINRDFWEIGTRDFPFVPGVKSESHTSLPMHTSTPGLGGRAEVLISFYGPGYVWCILYATWTWPSHRSLWEGAKGGNALSRTLWAPLSIGPEALWAQSLSLFEGVKAHPRLLAGTYSSSAACLDTVGLLEEWRLALRRLQSSMNA